MPIIAKCISCVKFAISLLFILTGWTAIGAYDIITVMNIAGTMKRTVRAAARILAGLAAAFLLAGSMQFCLCDEDPDNCGEKCHDCSTHQTQEDGCDHVTLGPDDFTVPDNDVLPVCALQEAPVPDFCVRPDFEIKTPPRPSAASPPPRRSQYVSYSPKLNPLS